MNTDSQTKIPTLRHSLHAAGSWISPLLELRNDPIAFFTRLSQQGSITRFRLGLARAYFISDPSYIRHVLQDNPGNYLKRGFAYDQLRLILGNGLVTADGPTWQRNRKLAQPHFRRERLLSFTPIMSEATSKMLDRWESSSDDGGPTLDVAEEMVRVTLEVVSKSLFGSDISQDTQALSGAVLTLQEEANRRSSTLFNLPLFLPTGQNRRFRSALASLDDFVYELIRERSSGSEGRTDLLSMLINSRYEQEDGERMSDRQLRDEILTLLVAGHETTASALTFTLYLLAQNPSAFERFRQEAKGLLGGASPELEQLRQLTYGRNVIQESLRLYPPAWFTLRQAVNIDEIGGHSIPSGSLVILSPFVMHHHPDYWVKPETFDPDRFERKEEVEKTKYAYIPFGAGPRVCVGSNFAMVEIQMILSGIVQRYRPQITAATFLELDPLITLRARRGLQLKMEKLSSP